MSGLTLLSIVYPLRDDATTEEKDNLCKVLELCAAQELCAVELVLITDVKVLKNELVPKGKISESIQIVLPHIKALNVTLKIVKIDSLNREKFIRVGMKASTGFAMCMPPIDPRIINDTWYAYPLNKLLEREDIFAAPLVFYELMQPHPLLFEHTFISYTRLYKREELNKKMASGAIDKYNIYMRKALAAGSWDMDDDDIYNWAFIFAQKGFCSALAVLCMDAKQREGIYFALQHIPIEQEILSLGEWDVPHKDLDHVGLFSAVDLPLCTKPCPANNILIGTSIAPHRLQEQKLAINSWIMQGFSVVSVNYASEIAEVQAHFPEVRFIEAKQDSMPTLGKKRVYIDEVLEALRAEGHKFNAVGLVNSDVGLYHISPQRIIEQCANGLLISHRINLPKNNVQVFGYDAYFFNLDAIPREERLGEYFLGEPWWDIIFPVYFLRHGANVMQANPPLCFHMDHEQQWGDASFNERGAMFAQYLYQSLMELKPFGLSLQNNFPDITQEANMVWLLRIIIFWCRHLPANNVFEELKLEY